MVHNFKQDQLVSFTYSGIEGLGTVVGCGLVDMPIVGKHYLVKLIQSTVDHIEYPFDTIMLPEHCLKSEEVS